MEDVEQVIARHRIKRHATDDVEKLEEAWTLYSETGFELKARELKLKLLFAKAAQKLGNPIIVKRPELQGAYNHVYPFPKLWLDDIGDRHYGGDSIYLWEVEPQFFKGDVPTEILKATLTAKTLGFKPYVWFVSRPTKVGELLQSPMPRADPAIVAYPIVGKENGEDVVNNEYGIVLGLWGKDVEQIDKALNARDDSAKGDE